MKSFLASGAASLSAACLLAACATPDKAGVRDPAMFPLVAERSVVTSDRDYVELARCFETRGEFLPMTRFISAESGDAELYRLRGFGFTFEEIAFAGRPGGGSEATVLLAPNLNSKWRADFAKDRLAPLEACASPSSNAR